MSGKKMVKQPSNYEVISKLQKLDFFSQLLTKAILPMYWVDYKVIYDFYSQEKLKVKKSQAITNTSEEYKVSEGQIYHIIKRMEN